MKRNVIGLSLGLAAAAALVVLSRSDAQQHGGSTKVTKAIAVLHPTQGNTVRGTVTFTKVRSAAPDLPVVLLVQTDQDVLRLSPGELGPFVTVREAHADPSLLRTLVVSAALLGRALRRFPDARVRIAGRG